MNAEELRNALRQFTGTENWYRHELTQNMTYTDGVKFFADRAGAYWLVDIMAMQPEISQAPFSHVALLVMEDETASLVADDGDGNVQYSRNIVFTDCPVGLWQFYVTDRVIMLPSEY